MVTNSGTSISDQCGGDPVDPARDESVWFCCNLSASHHNAIAALSGDLFSIFFCGLTHKAQKRGGEKAKRGRYQREEHQIEHDD